MFNNKIFLRDIEQKKLQEIGLHASTLEELVPYFDIINRERVRLLNDNSHQHNTTYSQIYKDVLLKLSWFTDEGILAVDGFVQYLMDLRKEQRSRVASRFSETIAMVDSSCIELTVDLDKISYTYNCKTKKFLDFGRDSGTIVNVPDNPLYPKGCQGILYFPFYNFIGFTNIKFKNIIFRNCFVINSNISFTFENCKLT